jgi:MFS transporter, NNP family, nitrate/nitrite transporter
MARYSTITGQGLLLLMFLWFLWFMNFSIRTIFSPLMPLVEDEFAIHHAQASSFFVFNALGYGTALLLTGLFAGRYGYKRSIIFSLVLLACSFFLIPFVESFAFLSFLSFIIGLGSGIYLPSVIPLITHYFGIRSWGKAIAIHDSAASVSIFAAPFIALSLLNFVHWRQIFDVFGAIAIVNVFIFSLVAVEVKIDQPMPNSHNHLLRQRSLWIIALIWIFASGANLGLYFILPLYLIKELNMESVYANQIFGLSRIGGVFAAIAVGFIADRFSLKKTMFWLVFLTGILTLCLTFTGGRTFEVFLFLQAAAGFGFFPLGLVTISRLFKAELRSMATGYIVTLGVLFGLGIIPYLLGVAGDLLSFRFGILILGVLCIMSSGLTYFLKEIK